MKRDTTGILMWSHIFLHNDNKDNIAILLLDTQGVFDNQSTAQDCAFIFSLSTLLSSVQIYNLMQNIQENDLQHLELFTEYGKMAMDKTNHKPYQRMQFLIRDWGYSYEYEYGANGGRAVLDEVLKTTNQHKEQTSVRENLSWCFSEMNCFLMPHPGQKVLHPNFKGQLDMITDDFKVYLKELVPSILGPENLLIKEVNGQQITVKDFIHYIRLYVKELSGDGIPKPETIMNANAEVNHMNILSEVTDLYIREMKEISDREDHMSVGAFKAKHDEIIVQIVDFVSIFFLFTHRLR